MDRATCSSGSAEAPLELMGTLREQLDALVAYPGDPDASVAGEARVAFADDAVTDEHRAFARGNSARVARRVAKLEVLDSRTKYRPCQTWIVTTLLSASCSTLRVLRFSGVGVPMGLAERLTALAPKLGALEEVDLRLSYSSDGRIEAMATALCSKPSVRRIELTGAVDVAPHALLQKRLAEGSLDAMHLGPWCRTFPNLGSKPWVLARERVAELVQVYLDAVASPASACESLALFTEDYPRPGAGNPPAPWRIFATSPKLRALTVNDVAFARPPRHALPGFSVVYPAVPKLNRVGGSQIEEHTTTANAPTPIAMGATEEYERRILAKNTYLSGVVVDWWLDRCVRQASREDAVYAAISDFVFEMTSAGESGSSTPDALHGHRFAALTDDKRYAVIPARFDNHFVLQICDAETDEVYSYDSMRGASSTRASATEERVFGTIKTALSLHARLVAEPTPVQPDGTTCGFVVCALLWRFMCGGADWRARMATPVDVERTRNVMAAQFRVDWVDAWDGTKLRGPQPLGAPESLPEDVRANAAQDRAFVRSFFAHSTAVEPSRFPPPLSPSRPPAKRAREHANESGGG